MCNSITTDVMVWFMVFNATFNNISVISWWSVLLVEETEVPGENHWPVASNWQTLSHKTLVVTGTDCTGSRKSNYHTTPNMTNCDSDNVVCWELQN